jgi:hypothetical protein
MLSLKCHINLTSFFAEFTNKQVFLKPVRFSQLTLN